MKRHLATVAGLCVLFAAPGQAQRWSVDQQQVIDLVVRCNDGWVESMAQQDYDVFARSCPQTPDAVFWYTAQDTPVRYEGPDGFWQAGAANVKTTAWRDLEPVAVNVDGDVALVYFSVVWAAERRSGETVGGLSRRLNVFTRRNGTWLLAGGSIAGVNQP